VSLNCIPSTQLSSNEAESWVHAGAEADGIWLINYLTEIGEAPARPVPIRIDNSIAVEQAHANVLATGSRHYQRRIAFVQGNEQTELFKTMHTGDSNMSADSMGKWVPTVKFKTSRTHWLNLSAQVPVPGK